MLKVNFYCLLSGKEPVTESNNSVHTNTKRYGWLFSMNFKIMFITKLYFTYFTWLSFFCDDRTNFLPHSDMCRSSIKWESLSRFSLYIKWTCVIIPKNVMNNLDLDLFQYFVWILQVIWYLKKTSPACRANLGILEQNAYHLVHSVRLV